jgi:hypothetical protein
LAFLPKIASPLPNTDLGGCSREEPLLRDRQKIPNMAQLHAISKSDQVS